MYLSHSFLHFSKEINEARGTILTRTDSLWSHDFLKGTTTYNLWETKIPGPWILKIIIVIKYLVQNNLEKTFIITVCIELTIGYMQLYWILDKLLRMIMKLYTETFLTKGEGLYRGIRLYTATIFQRKCEHHFSLKGCRCILYEFNT